MKSGQGESKHLNMCLAMCSEGNRRIPPDVNLMKPTPITLLVCVCVCVCVCGPVFVRGVFAACLFWAPIVRKRALNARLPPLEYRIHARFYTRFHRVCCQRPRGGFGGVPGGCGGGGGSGLGGFRGGSGGVIIPFRTTCVFACAMLT